MITESNRRSDRKSMKHGTTTMLQMPLSCIQRMITCNLRRSGCFDGYPTKSQQATQYAYPHAGWAKPYDIAILSNLPVEELKWEAG
jgi:hypothetical protein